jgi:peroxiredoxin
MHIIIFLIFGLVFLATQTRADMLDPGSQAPLFTVTDTAGTVISLSSFPGKVVVLEWANTDCPAVRKEYEQGIMQRLQDKARRNGMVWLTIFTPTPGHSSFITREEAKQAMLDWKGTPTDVVIDPGNVLAKLYAVSTAPIIFVVNASGNIAYEGAVDEQTVAPHGGNFSHSYLDFALETLSKAPFAINNPSMSTAAGCPISHP